MSKIIPYPQDGGQLGIRPFAGNRYILDAGETAEMPVGLHENADIKQYHDSIKLVRDTTSYKLFINPDTSGSDQVFSNAEKSPLPGAFERPVLGIGLHVNMAAMASAFAASTSGSKLLGKTGWADNVNPIAVLNFLRTGIVKITTGGQQKRMAQFPLAEFFADTHVASSQSDGDGREVYFATIPVVPPKRLRNWFTLAAGETLEVVVTFPNAANIPTEAEWISAGAGQALRLYATIIVAEPKDNS